ncbi:unnamed protein product [Notodromas monacha]|uniref:Sarcalumenin n=1 Tax=Notodromas monacha TaxID=399045 RepID=A0A7R9BLA5_9CRUS|nr:unnamed protein product [Notodromas monacha]CAG0917577.1 unnamed protein product [Notodromas monacha]
MKCPGVVFLAALVFSVGLLTSCPLTLSQETDSSAPQTTSEEIAPELVEQAPAGMCHPDDIPKFLGFSVQVRLRRPLSVGQLTPEVSGSSEEVPPVSTEEPQAAEGESHEASAVEPTTETSSSEIPVSESEEEKLSLVEGEPTLSVENASGETEQPEAVPETDPTISAEIIQETSLESPASAETTPPPEEQPICQRDKDAEISAKPLILLMGPTGTGKTSAIKYLLGLDSASAIPRIPIGPVPAQSQFTIWRHAENPSVEMGPELAADATFTTLQKFGLSALDRVTGIRLKAPLLDKVTIVDAPAIIESIGHLGERRTVPVNDLYQWFIDRADLILLLFDPHKPDVGMELEALMDQLKGREAQTRIVVNKADSVSASDLTVAQANLLWNLAPMLGGNRAPALLSVSLRNQAYKSNSCSKLLSHQEELLYQDIIDVFNNQIGHKIASARRHAIRVRNHSKLVNLYLKAYAKNKGLFSNKKKVALQILDDPFKYRIYQEVAFNKNVSRYDLPDPEIYREFFMQHTLFDFKKFEDLCTYFKGCPQDKLDLAIAYEFPEIVAKFKSESSTASVEPAATQDSDVKGQEMPVAAA